MSPIRRESPRDGYFETDDDRAEASSATDHRTVRLEDGRVVAYAEYGDPAGDPVVFLHGTPGSRVSGRLFAEDAAAHEVRIVAPDRPGYGRSTPQPDRTLTAVGPVVERVLDDAGVHRAGVIGFSGGGPHALALAATRPERLERVDVISGAVPPALSGPRPFTLRALEILAVRTPRLLRGLFAVQAGVSELVGPRTVLSQYTDEPNAVPEADAEVVARDFREAFARHRQGAVTDSRLLADDWGFDLASVDRPIHLWHGRADTNVPLEGARRLAEQLPEASLTVSERDHLGTLLEARRRVLEAHRSENEG